MKNLLSEATITAGPNGELSFEAVRKMLKDKTYACVKGLFTANEVLGARKKISASFNIKDDRKHDPKDAEAIRNNFQKLQVGGTKGVNSCPRFLRMMYNPTFAADIYGMHDIFRRLIIFRNRLYSLPEEFTVGKTEKGMWTASRLMQYPTGGGFMAQHTDVGTNTVSVEMNMEQYIQLILVMSKKGVDFKEGGAYIVDKDGNRNFIEDECEYGDIIIYDGRVMHGVEEIDPMEPLDLDTFNGRIVALVTLFKHFSKEASNEEYKALMKN